MLRCVLSWTCGHSQQDFHVNPDAVDLQAVMALTDSHCPQCGRAGARITLHIDRPAGSTTVDRLPAQGEHRPH